MQITDDFTPEAARGENPRSAVKQFVVISPSLADRLQKTETCNCRGKIQKKFLKSRIFYHIFSLIERIYKKNAWF